MFSQNALQTNWVERLLPRDTENKKLWGNRKLWIFSAAVALLVGLSLLVGPCLSLEQIVAQETLLRRWIRGDPVIAFVAGLLIYFLLSLVPGTSGKSVVFGWLFGLPLSSLIAVSGLTLSSITTFTLSRYLFRDVIESRFSRFLVRFNRVLDREGAFYMLSLRMMHAPFTFVNYTAGASRIRITTFIWTTMIGLTPSTIIFCFVGTKLPTLREFSERGVQRLLDPWLLAALVGTGAFPLLARGIIHTVHTLRASHPPTRPKP